MPVYVLHGFRWPRAGFTGIRVYVVLHNLEDATAEYLQQPLTSRLILDSLKRGKPNLMPNLPDLQLIEAYDPEDTTSNTAVSQPFAYVAAKVITIPDPGAPGAGLSWNLEDLVKDPGLPSATTEALEGLRDELAPGEKIGWWVVYNGDPERYFPETDEEDDDESMEYEDEEDASSIEEQPQPTTVPEKQSTRFPGKLTRLFGKRSNTTTA
ncbi:hypothetical protein ASPWEDRAFT_40225 [Aspergillus wentii DTO 134E9]|uniref:Developmental regulator FlbE n=1 Tax=Aspergillus wentii DTO 134E9 TaxID=1073089 RepID=A0A1L9RJK0_ASPWE|nr:uncharacterized protein ASPWEDRAFT_40225 [Aspergillus wentii DTO 134E9]OJJ35083.1 hypothetical protein ASPWEDRAFT_40225 [Aspergillus wentii DTO 134E9]